ncbi:MAG: CoA-binding protein [candidate division KSB1 bacterium]|nr:CoA-binding protein [candidate division KSB1 bacterium]MDZ7357519.1 CoA-binding protein [candidate division KSB1 bacterium]MDZ7375787.1 CoA-binding protein [candidate division KSB1 bacterium]MDZ7399722.1 CoA-binding protein [candidate division KSB1 bacterium]
MTDLEKMMQFWKKRHLALFGFSRNPARVSRQVYDLLISNGYHIYPINPNANQIDSIKCYRSLDEIHQELEGAIIITNPTISLEVVKQCHQRGIKEFWFQLNTMDDAVREYLNKNGLSYFYNCILMNPHLLRSASSIQRAT